VNIAVGQVCDSTVGSWPTAEAAFVNIVVGQVCDSTVGSWTKAVTALHVRLGPNLDISVGMLDQDQVCILFISRLLFGIDVQSVAVHMDYALWERNLIKIIYPMMPLKECDGLFSFSIFILLLIFVFECFSCSLSATIYLQMNHVYFAVLSWT